MRVALHDAEKDHMKGKTFPNYALMKISAWHKAQGDIVEWFDAENVKTYDRIYSSKVFDFTPENPDLPNHTIKGGTGYDIESKLPQEIDDECPDYSIYPECDYAIGYLTRGCPNRCKWCVVPKKEGNIHSYRIFQNLVRPDTNKLVLMDNNILASPFGINQLRRLTYTDYQIDLNQGMDARLVTHDIAAIIARIKWIRFIRFSCDTDAQVDEIERVLDLLNNYGIKPWRISIYMLVTSDVEKAAARVERLKRYKGISLYAQAERNEKQGIKPNREQLDFSQRYVYKKLYRVETWAEYKARHEGDR